MPCRASARRSLAHKGSRLAELVKEVARMTPSLALELGKSAPVVHCHDVTTVLTGDWVQRMKDTLVQCFRNALYHGIEPREARCATAKTPEGHIRIEPRPSAMRSRFASQMMVEGFHWSSCATRRWAASLSLTSGRRTHFQRGVSSAASVGAVAGRGVGLDLVRLLFRERVVMRSSASPARTRRSSPYRVLVLVLPSSERLVPTIEVSTK